MVERPAEAESVARCGCEAAESEGRKAVGVDPDHGLGIADVEDEEHRDILLSMPGT